jgi:glycosyltransferase involved in cell wall biosynthesis
MKNNISPSHLFAYSVVIPMKNEEGNVLELIAEVESVMQKMGKPWELICINDGSTDRTEELLKELEKTKPFLKIITFERNFGQSSAFDAGFKHSQGEFVITLDGDRQNDPADIPTLIHAMSEADLICGWRINRKDTWFKRIISILANKIRTRMCDDGVHDTGCSLKVYRKDCLTKIKMYQGMHRFLPALFKIENFRVKEIPVNHRERVSGKTKYNLLNRSFNTIADMFAVNWMRKRRLLYKIHNSREGI